MTDEQKYELNEFFVHVFNQILAWEGQTLRKTNVSDLSVRELHIIDSIQHLTPQCKNTMANVAKFLSVTPGALTTAVNTLVKKGYLERSYTKEDRRIVFIALTEQGEAVNKIHSEYHRQMVESLDEVLEEESLKVLLDALRRLGVFFRKKAED